MFNRVEMRISINMVGRAEVMLAKTLEAGQAVVDVVLLAGVEILTDWGLGLRACVELCARVMH